MSLASIQRIVSVQNHPNADLLDIVKVMNYEAIVKRGAWNVGDFCVFIEPDSVLPQVPWSVFYRSKSNRVKAVKLRGSWSFGIVESLANVGYTGNVEEGLDLTDTLGVTKYEAPQPQDLAASGPFMFGIPRTDETKWNGIRDLPLGELCDVTLKRDGQSWSGMVWNEWGEEEQCMIMKRAIGGRSFLYQLDTINNYTRNEQQYDVLNKLEAFCRAHHRESLCIRGESFGAGINKSAPNHDAKQPLSLNLYSTWLIDQRRYARKGDPFYIFDIAPQMGLPTVPVIEKDVVLTRELIAKYATGITEIDGKPFEGVVINWAGGSFKVLSLQYDSLK